MNRKGFTLMEVLFSVCILTFLTFVVIQLFAFASKYYNFGSFRLRQLSRLRLALELLKADIRESGSDLKIINGNKTLQIRKFASDSLDSIKYSKDGMPENGEFCEYRFIPSLSNSEAGILYRNNKIILSDVSNVDFSFNKEQVNDSQLLRVIVTIDHQIGGGKTVIHVSPRHLASWVRDPFWASICNDQRFKYQFQ